MNHMFCIVLVLQLFTLTGAVGSGIVGGKESKPHSRPYMASLQFQGFHSCGGILIRKDFVVTAAHCNQSQQEMTVVLGAHDISKEEKSQQRIQVARYYTHPNYKAFDYDIMLLKLKQHAKLNKYVKPIELPKKDGKIPANIKCTVAGWGQTGANKPPSNVLRETTEKLQFSMECKNIWKQYFNSDHMICTKFKKTTGGVCQGDSGGPLICNTKPQGLTAYTLQKDCSNPKYPHVFTKIHFFLPWIKKIMKV
ncbi:granzyme B-like [Betta splendens]|uniref:Granzyme B-like n=1 Tax=Betta splendens TaxID=158456 RepID=A0A6P7LD67_BETSP|nr:granzyme B-like [Betta splendens]